MFYTNLRCEGSCKTGVLLRAEKTPDGGMKGVYVSLTDGDFATYQVTIDAQGVETSRDRGRRGGARRRRGRSCRRPAPPELAQPRAGSAPAGGAPAGAPARRRAAAADGGAGGAAPAPAAAAVAEAAAAARRAITALKPGEWNPLDILVSDDDLRASHGRRRIDLPPEPPTTAPSRSTSAARARSATRTSRGKTSTRCAAEGTVVEPLHGASASATSTTAGRRRRVRHQSWTARWTSSPGRSTTSDRRSPSAASFARAASTTRRPSTPPTW